MILGQYVRKMFLGHACTIYKRCIDNLQTMTDYDLLAQVFLSICSLNQEPSAPFYN
jgi:hypothetical protein